MHLILLTSILPYFFWGGGVKIDRKLIYSNQFHKDNSISENLFFYFLSLFFSQRMIFFHCLHNRQYKIEHLSTPLKNNHSKVNLCSVWNLFQWNLVCPNYSMLKSVEFSFHYFKIIYKTNLFIFLFLGIKTFCNVWNLNRLSAQICNYIMFDNIFLPTSSSFF